MHELKWRFINTRGNFEIGRDLLTYIPILEAPFVTLIVMAKTVHLVSSATFK